MSGEHYAAKHKTYEAPAHLTEAKTKREVKRKAAAKRRKGSSEPWNDPLWRAQLLKQAFLAYQRAHRQAFGR